MNEPGEAEGNLGERELHWFFQHKAELEEEHPGEWVAIGPHGMVSVGPDIAEVMREAKVRGVPDAIPVGIRAKEFQGVKSIGGAGLRIIRASEP